MPTDIEPPALARQPTINSYRHAIGLIWERLRWDMTGEAIRSRRKLQRCRDRHLGRKAVIVCNGPSLLRSNLAALDGIFTFGLNKINLLFDRSPFRPTAIVATNPFVIEQTKDFYNTTDIPLYLDSGAVRHVRSRANIVYLHSAGQSKFARDCSMSIFQGFTVTYVALQLAFHMGFRDVALIGCDHTFASKGAANQTVSSEVSASDASHFDLRYFSGGQKWQLPDLAASEYYYSLAGEVFRAFGGRITNCTEGGKLEVYPRQELGTWIGTDLHAGESKQERLEA